jgi:PAS domain S-box-containing protein
MNPYSVPSLICFFLMPFLGAFIYSQNRQSQIHKLFIILAVVVAYWAFIEFNLRQSSSYNDAFFWTRAGCFKIILSPLLIHFLLAYIDKWKNYNKLKAISLIYLPAVLISLLDLFTGAVSGIPIKEAWGWSVGRPAYPAVFIFYFSWKIFALSFVVKESATYIRNAKNEERKSFWLFFCGIIASVVLGILSTTVASSLRPNFPELSIIIALLFSVYLTYIIWKYNLFYFSSDTTDNIIDLLGDCFILAGAHNQILRVNRELCKLSGYTEKELINENISRLIEGVSEPRHDTDGKIFSRDSRLILKTGQFIPILLSETVVCNKARIPVALILIAKDLTFWHKSQQEFVRAEKLESFELIIRSIVHDFNNLLSTISGHLMIADESGDIPEPLKQNIATAEKAVSVAANLTKRLSMYAKETELHVSPCVISEIIEESAELALKGSLVRFDFFPDKDLWPIIADKYQMIQVFINLFINARQAMLKTGTLSVKCSNFISDEQREFVKVSIHDQGGGIPPNLIDHIFEPFFTTKPTGSGLGLSIVRNIIKAHRGTISVESHEKIGTTFTILLPKASDIFPEKIDEPHPAKNTPSKKILVMDDEDTVRTLFSMLLSKIGHTVELAKNGSEAIEIFNRAKSGGASFDCVILDLTIVAGVGAEQAIKRILEIDPEIKAILTSGYTAHPVIENYKSHGFHSVLTKPFTSSEIQNAIFDVFEKTPAN